MQKDSITLKSKLQSGQLTLGSWITLGHPAIAEIFAGAGYDWLVVDLEHSTISMEQAGELIRIIDLAGVAPLVRLTSNEPNQIKRIMDAGAHGIVVPMVNSPEDAVKAVAATRYAPLGIRGVGLARAQKYGAGFQDYLEWQKDGPVVIVQIEHKLALDVLDSILSVKGVDGFIIGPYDLSCSMGIPGEFEQPEFLDAMDFIKNTGERLKCPGGIHIVEPDQERLRQAIGDGYRFIAYSVDIRMLDVSARIGVKSVLTNKDSNG
ncbi:2,4-dihydroxyhept-2-ene-1,7-dioic acid aldolase [Desulfocapsa sulfexigens DSM 10523]|uniref:2,4-dihydroxyhept-2-ene-1,7-dioic acid aldolase n=1 Tax=Desulfocapsa sulfexigens (strain DSM 10523 / SB164P1) TaxID=1167006 RepID=M1PRK2_DESSD|nr:aldolase/citrate lyase family protein [Desulfocapsa sulfexigens]AGF78971.1 2,4-dihydroxyhept-2-ene-1,7-dioic acid aldolase [Desulfocapsa sulfexigens DSM 10523]